MSIIENKTLVELHEGLRNKEFTSVELTKETFERIHALEPKVEAFVTLNEVDTTGVPVTTHGYPLVNVMREDAAEKGTDRDLLMRNVKTSEDGFIQVPAIMGENEEGEA